jgi:hypothetical protein
MVNQGVVKYGDVFHKVFHGGVLFSIYLPQFSLRPLIAFPLYHTFSAKATLFGNFLEKPHRPSLDIPRAL